MVKNQYIMPEKRRLEISVIIHKNSNPTTYYYFMVIIACVIATYGLLLNSSAIIIGAMLISPLITPVIGIALGASEADGKLVKISIRSLLAGVLIAISLSILLSMLIPERIITSEILSRTKPTLFDLIIAMAAGAAGAYAICYKPSAAILPGVAISTALMPPLCVIGIGAAFNNFNVYKGAFLLFIANIIAIAFSGILVFNILGFKKVYDITQKVNPFIRGLRNNIIYSTILLLIIAVPLSSFMINAFIDNKIKSIISNTIRDEINTVVINSEISSLTYEKNNEGYKVDIVVRSTQPFTNDNIRKVENLLEYKLALPVDIEANIILVQKISKSESINGYNELFITLNDEKDKPIEIIEVKTPEEIIGGTIEEKLSLFPEASYDSFHFSYDGKTGIYDIEVIIQYDGEFDENLDNSISAILEDKLKRKVNLVLIIKSEAEVTNKPASESVAPSSDKAEIQE